MVEFALVGMTFFLILIGIMEGGRLLWLNHELTNGTREAARFAMVHGAEASTCVTLTDLTDEIEAHTSGLNADDLSPTGDTGPFSPCPAPGSKFVVEYEYDFTSMIGIIPGFDSITLSARSEVIIQH
jgi:Flp pilus assembly protein TadG